MTVEFRVFGGLEVRADGALIDMGHARQQNVAATLLAEANRTVTVDQLIERLWDGKAPQRAKETVYSYLSRIRKALADVAVIERRGGGYLLRIDPETVDLYRFRQLAGQARQCPDDERQAARLYRQALDLWRGEPFEGLHATWLDDLRTTLHAEYHTVRLDYHDARLELGEHAALLDQLNTLAARYPLDERLCAQLMLALYRSGRRTSALESYQRLRDQLAEELGSDPAPQLRQLHRRILESEPGRTAASTADPPATSPRRSTVPRQLPAPPRRFTGRVEELAHLDDARHSDGEANLWVISGLGGTGKTWMALHWAHRNAEAFIDGQMYLNLRGFDPAQDPMATQHALRTLLTGLGLDPAGLPAERDSLAALYRSTIANRRMLIVLDNVRDAAQVTPLLPGNNTCVTIITSRLDLTALTTAHGAEHISLSVLDEDEAYDALVAQLGSERAGAEPDAVAELLDHCGGLPLALGILASRAAIYQHNPLTVLAAELHDDTGRLDSLDTGELSVSLRAVFSSSYRALSPEAAALFDQLGLAPGTDVGLFGIASLTAQSPARTRVLMRELESAHLAEQHLPGRYRMHDLVRLFASECGAHLPPPRQDAAIHRFIDHYLHTAAIADPFLDNGRQKFALGDMASGVTVHRIEDEKSALTWFAHTHDTLLTAQTEAAKRQWDDMVWQLAWHITSHLYQRGYFTALQDIWQRADESAQRLGRLDIRSVAHTYLGQTATFTGDHDRAMALLRHGLAFAQEADDPAQQAIAQYGLALCCEAQGAYSPGLEHAIASLELLRSADIRYREIHVVNGVGWLYAMTGDYESARRHCREALELVERYGEPIQRGDICDSLGYIARGRGKPWEAREWYWQALQAYRRFDITADEAATLEHLAAVHDELGDAEAAHGFRCEAAAAYRAQGKHDQAQQVLQEAPH